MSAPLLGAGPSRVRATTPEAVCCGESWWADAGSSMLAVRPRLTRHLVLFVAALVLLAGCNVQLEVMVDVEEDGSGSVTAGVGLDAEASARFPNVDSLLVTSDLSASGWEVEPSLIRSDNREWVAVTQDFDNPDELQALLDQLFGPQAGVFTGWEIVRAGDRTSESYDVVGTVNLDNGLSLFTDEALVPLLDNPPLGRSIEEIEADIGIPIGEAVDARVVVELPTEGSRQEFATPLGETTTIVAQATSENRVAQLLGWVRTALIALFVLSVVLAVINFLLDRRAEQNAPQRRPERMRSRVPQGPDGAPDPAGAGAGPRMQMQMIVLDAHDVLYAMSSDPHERLIPFIRENKGTAPDEEIVELYRQATLGRLHAAAFWQAVGVAGEPQEIDAKFLAGVRLQSGAKEFLREMHRRGVPVAVITNDLAEWSYRLRDLHGLSGVAPWIVSSDIGVRKPDPAAFEALRRLTGVPYHSILAIDGQIPALDMAASLGMMTSWFAREEPADGAEPGHAVVTRFGDFFRRRRPPEPAGRRRRQR